MRKRGASSAQLNTLISQLSTQVECDGKVTISLTDTQTSTFPDQLNYDVLLENGSGNARVLPRRGYHCLGGLHSTMTSVNVTTDGKTTVVKDTTTNTVSITTTSVLKALHPLGSYSMEPLK